MAAVAAEAADPRHGGRYGLDPPLVVAALGYQARALIDLGALEDAAAAVAACRAQAEAVDRPFSWTFLAMAEGALLLAQGNARAAVAKQTEALAMCDRGEAELLKVVALTLLGQALLAVGEAAAAVERLVVAIRMAERMGFLVQQPLRLTLLEAGRVACGSIAAAGAPTAAASSVGNGPATRPVEHQG